MKNKFKKNIFIILSFIVSLTIVSVASVLYMNYKVSKSGDRYIMKMKDLPQCDAVLVLGAYVAPDGKLSDMLKDRTDVGLQVYNDMKASKILLSGDHGKVNYDEVNGMKNYVVSKGVKPENVFMDHAGFSTYDSMYRARDIFKIKKLIIVTQGYHLKRAVFIARELGIEAYGVSSDLQPYRGILMYENREILARVKAFINIYFTKPQPKFLGDEIPIYGDGRVTDDKLKK